MNKIKTLLLIAFLSSISFAAKINDVSLVCKKEKCHLVFQFASAKDLPSFFQKYEASSKKFTVAFSETDFILGEGSFDIDAKSSLIQKMKVFTEQSKKANLLKFEFTVGSLITSDKNKINLANNGTDFGLELVKSTDKDWAISKKFAEQKKAAEKAALEEKKNAGKKALEEKVRLAEEKKAAEKAALEEKKRLAQEKKTVGKPSTESKTAKAPIESKPVSALIEGIQEMIALSSFGLEQFQLVTDDNILLSNISKPNRQVITIGLAGPAKSPVFKVNAGTIVKSIYWSTYGLNIELHPGIQPSIIVRKGVLILQVTSDKKIDGMLYWHAKPSGIKQRQWIAAKEGLVSFDAFTKKLESESKKLVSVSQTFYLRPTARELIVVSEEIELLAKPNEKAQVLQRLVFSDRLVSLENAGLFQKVQFNNKTGFVYKRAVSFRDELSSMQLERLKQIAFEKGENLDSIASRFETISEDRVAYSSFGRRDPFVEIKGLVEEGINIDQVELVGIIWETQEPMAILAESKNPTISYTIKEGDKILNGKVLKITQTDVLFLIQEFGVSRRYSMGLPDKYGSLK
ncbi:MAG TPA: hypothetical protein GX724_02180 [Fibrobacter sp.]|nr:hypothetical protein [Fibrobacter sp.]